MTSTIRSMKAEDKACVIEMMRVFYTSPAVLSNGSEEIFLNDVENCVNESPYLEGYIFENSTEVQGYAMVAKSFSTEFGKQCIWIEEENERAVRVYEKCGFEVLPYMEMKK